MLRVSAIVVAGLLVLVGCGERAPSPPSSATPTPDDPSAAGFVAHDRDWGLTHVNVSGGPDKRYIVEANGSGVCSFDFDRDGDEDLYFVNGQTLDGVKHGRSTLYRNLGDGHRGDGRFEDVTEASGTGDDGWGFGCAVADVDRDGLTDLFVTGWRTSRLYRNLGGGRFEETSLAAGVRDDHGWGESATFGDYDKDGFPDLYVARYLHFDPAVLPPGPAKKGYRGLKDVFRGPISLDPMNDLLYHNRGDGTFEDVSEQSGVRRAAPAYGLAVTFVDLDRDGWLDILVANDSVPSHAQMNDGHGTFTDRAFAMGLAISDEGRAHASMGIAVGDVNEDDRDDFYVTTFSEDKKPLYLATDEGFEDASFTAGLVKPSWLKLAWGTFFFDYDLDGHLDLFVATGHVYPKIDGTDFGLRYADEDQLFHGDGTGHFEERVLGDLGKLRAVSRGAIFSDLDRDGDLDVVVSRLDELALIYENRAATGGFVAPLLDGRDCDRDAFGAVLHLRVGERSIRRTVFSGGTYAGTSQLRTHFGTGDARGPFPLEVTWPCGKKEWFTVDGGSFPTLVEGMGRASR